MNNIFLITFANWFPTVYFRGLSRPLSRLKTFRISTSMVLKSATIITKDTQVEREDLKGIITTTTLTGITITTTDTEVEAAAAAAAAGEMATFITTQSTTDGRHPLSL